MALGSTKGHGRFLWRKRCNEVCCICPVLVSFHDCDKTLETISLMKAKVCFCAPFQRLFSLLQASGGGVSW